jgi:hypothetical protein
MIGGSLTNIIVVGNDQFNDDLIMDISYDLAPVMALITAILERLLVLVWSNYFFHQTS